LRDSAIRTVDLKEKYMAEITENQKLLWPSRLLNLSQRFLIAGIVISVLGIPLASITWELGGIVLSLSGVAIIALSLICAVISLIGLLCYKFKIAGAGKALGLIIISYPLFALGLAVLVPTLEAPAEQKRIDCLFNFRTLTLSCEVYHTEHKLWPTPEKWCDSIKPYDSWEKDKNYFQCPKDKVGPCSYAMNKNIPAEANDLPPDLVLLFESTPGWNQTGGPEDVVTDRHRKNNPGTNIAFADGRVEFVKAEDIPKLRWVVGEK